MDIKSWTLKFIRKRLSNAICTAPLPSKSSSTVTWECLLCLKTFKNVLALWTVWEEALKRSSTVCRLIALLEVDSKYIWTACSKVGLLSDDSWIRKKCKWPIIAATNERNQYEKVGRISSRCMPIAQYIAPFKLKMVGSPAPESLIRFKDKVYQLVVLVKSKYSQWMT